MQELVTSEYYNSNNEDHKDVNINQDVADAQEEEQRGNIHTFN